MERLTYRLEDQYGNPTDSIILESDLIFLNSSEKWKKVLSRLAAYEDTGLEPEEVRSQKELFDYLVFDSTPSEDVERFKRLRELAEADREGRCVVLPRLEPGQGDDPGPPGVPGPPGRHMTNDKLIRWLRTASGSIGGVKMSRAAADALAELQAENAYMRELLHRYCSCKVCANAADPFGLHCKFGGCNGGGNGAAKEDRWELRQQKTKSN